jgi:hypothetical protein
MSKLSQMRCHRPILLLPCSVCIIILSPPALAELPPDEGTSIPHLEARDVQAAVRAAVETFNGFRCKEGTMSLLDLSLQKNTVAGILHNLIGKELAKRAPYWTFKESGAVGADLIGEKDEPLDLKTSSGLDVKGNQVSRDIRYYLVVHFVLRPERDELVVVWVRAGQLEPGDWRRPKGTQWAFLTETGAGKLRTLWKDLGALPPASLSGIGEVLERRLAEKGIHTVRQVMDANLKTLQEALEMSAEEVRKVKEEARRVSSEK